MKTAALFLLAPVALSAYGGIATNSLDATMEITPTAVSASVNGSIGYEAATFAGNESSGSVTITAVRRTATKGAMSVNYSTANGSAVAGTNYTAEAGTLSWADGDGANKTFTVPLNTSNVFTGTKTFIVKMTAGANTVLGSHTSATVTITGGASSSSGSGFVQFDDSLPAAGSSGTDAIPSGAGLEDVSHPTHVIGTGTPASCTSAAVVAAVKTGGIITFDCGAAPVTIQMTATAQLFNNGAAKTVIDGDGKVTLSGMNARRILYMNTCDESLVWTTPNCNNQEYPQLTVQNITFSNGNASTAASPEGGAIYASGGRLKVVNSRFFSNKGQATGIKAYGGAIFAFQQYEGLPVYVVHSTFGGESNLSNTCANGGALGSIATSWGVYNSELTYNHATGNGGNPPASGTPGGGSGGAFYDDGYTFTLTLAGSTVNYNSANEYGAALTFILDNSTGGSLIIKDSTIMGNTGGTWYPKYPQISEEDNTVTTVTNSTIVN
jgi:hypothetical protein